MTRSTLLGTVALISVWACYTVPAGAQQPNVTTTTVTSATGTITQLNYNNDGSVQGFLVGTNILLDFPTVICGGAGTLGAPGNSVTYSGTASTATSGFQLVRVSSFANNTTKATYTAPTGTSTSTAYGPTTGTVKQLNYADDGSIDGFLFAPSGSTSSIFVSTGPAASATLKPLLTIGGTVSVTGTTSPSMNACSATATLQAVDASSVTIGTQTVVISGHGNDGHGGPGFGPGGRGGRH